MRTYKSSRSRRWKPPFRLCFQAEYTKLSRPLTGWQRDSSTRLPLPGGYRRCRVLSRNIRLRCRARSAWASRFRVLRCIYRVRCGGRRCRGYLCSGLAAEAPLFRRGGAVLRISGSRQRMIAPQPPPLPVFIPAQAMPGRDVPSQRLAPVATIETSHIVPVDGPSNRHSGSENLNWFGRLS